jgi:glycosyltransferase involved in cell wall biosynthesis
MGIGGARDFCIQHAQGKFIAFMDADDISYPQRIDKQLNFLQEHPEIIAVGVQTDLIDEKGKIFGKKTFPTDPATLRKMLYLYAPLQIPSTMVQCATLPADFKWFEGVQCGEDTILFFKLLQYGEFANLRETLYGYRQHATTTSSTKTKAVFKETWKARRLGRRQYGYRASLKMRIISGLQFIAVTFMPAAFINGFYQKTRVILHKIGRS